MNLKNSLECKPAAVNHMQPLAPVACAPKCVGTVTVIHDEIQILDIPNKKEETMYTIEQTRQNHLVDRLMRANRAKAAELRKQFYLEDDEAPRYAKDVVERILAGKYVLPSEDEQKKARDYYGHSFETIITWRDPAHPADQAGFEAAKEKLDKAYTAAKDLIIVKDADEGLAALQAFEKATFH